MDYLHLQGTATAQIRDKGAAITVSKLQPGVFDPATRTTTRPEPVVISDVFGVMTEFDEREIDGTNVLRGDRRLLIEVDGNPAVGDTITINGETLEVIDVKPLAPAGITLLHKAQVRK